MIGMCVKDLLHTCLSLSVLRHVNLNNKVSIYNGKANLGGLQLFSYMHMFLL